jgi:FixJ family two-component response regulator
MADQPFAKPTILAIFPPGDDRMLLRKLFDSSEWTVRVFWNFEEAATSLHAFPPGVVISEGRLPGSRSWKDLLREIQRIPDPPPLIVADRLADDRLWAEVLNLGGYDLLMKPFDQTEVCRVVTMACCFHARQSARPLSQRKPPVSAQSATAPAMRALAAGRGR